MPMFTSHPQKVLASVVIAIGTFASIVAIAGGSSTKDGAYTSEQAERGKGVYDKSCVNCHDEAFYRDKVAQWENKPVGALFESLAVTMPADNPGGLMTSEYVDVLAYIFSITGSPAGKEELNSDNMGTINVGPVQ